MEVYLSKDIEVSYSEILNTIKNVIDASNKESFFYDFEKLKIFNSKKNLLFRTLKEHAYKCEAISPGSFEVFFDSFFEKNSIDNHSLPKPLSKNNCFSILENFSDFSTSSLIFEALNLVGLEGKIILSKEVLESKNVLEVSYGCFFPNISSSFKLEKTKFIDTKILCIDGFIESVSEINRLLEEASKLNEALILFIRGLSNDVLHTLKINYDRKTLLVIPIVVPFDIDGINLLNDIAVSSGNDVVSNLKGQLISSLEIKNLHRVDSIDVTSSGVIIENKRCSSSIDNHICLLQKKILEEDNQITNESITKRIQNLGINRAVIKLSNHENFQKKFLMIDRSIRAIKSASTHGVIEYKGSYIPASSFFAGKFYHKKFISTIENIGAIIT